MEGNLMAERSINYLSKDERGAHIADQRGQGWRVLHDDYVDGWQRGDPLAGTLTFTDDPGTVSPPSERELEARRIRRAAQDGTLTPADRDRGLELLLEGL